MPIIFCLNTSLAIRWLTYETTQGKRKQAPNLQPLVASLEHFYMAEKLQLLSSELGNQQIMKAEPSHFLSQGRNPRSCQGATLITLPLLIQAYYLACNDFAGSGDCRAQIHVQLRAILSEQCGRFSSLKNCSISTAMPCDLPIRNISLEKEGYLHWQCLSCIMKCWNLGLLLEGELLPVNHYKNLTTLGLRLEDLEWAEAISSRTYKSSLLEEEDEAEAVYHYNLAHLRIYQKRYGEALQLLQTVIFLDPFYQLGTKMLQLKIFYEQQEIELFFSLAKTFHTHITRQKNIPASRQKAFLNFIKLTKSIFRIKIGEKSDQASLKEQIEQTIPLIEKEWILRKLEEVVA